MSDNFNIANFHENDFGLNVAWFDSANGRDRDLILWQGQCPDCDADSYVRLHPVHTLLLAQELGLLTAQEAAQGVERLQDRLTVLAALVRAHNPAGSPLRTAVDALLGSGSASRPVEVHSDHLHGTAASGASGDLFDGATQPQQKE